MSPGAAPRTSSLRTNSKNDLIAFYRKQLATYGWETAHRQAGDAFMDRCRAAVMTGATNEQIAHLVLGLTDAMDLIDSDFSAHLNTTP